MMKIKKVFMRGFPLVIVAGLAMSCFAASAEAAIAKIAKYSGEVIIQSGTGEQLTRVTAAGAPLNSGDRVLTRQGDAEVLFSDGAVMKVSPFSNAMLQERDEQGGFWIFKTSTAARRITCLVGKLFFQSGASGTKNYLQTPTAVAGIRGSSGDIGFDNLNTYLNMYVGEATVIGSVIRGFFQDPGVSAADKSSVYQSLVRAAAEKQRAEATGRTVDVAQALVSAVEVGKQVAEALKKNPDPVVQLDSKLIEQQTNAVMAVANAKVSVEQIKADKAAAEKAAADARQKGDATAAAAASAAAQQAEQYRIAAEQQVAAAAAASAQTTAAAVNRDLTGATQAAGRAEAAANQAQNLEKMTERAVGPVVPTTVTTVPATTVAPTTTATTVPALTTTIPTTVTTSSTSSTTTAETTTSVTPSP